MLNHLVCNGHTRPLTELTYVVDKNKGSTLLVSSAHDKLPQVRNGETCDWIGSFVGHKGAVWSIKIDKLTQTLAVTGSGDYSAKLWCVQSGKELHELKHKHVVKSVDFSMDTLKFATGSQDGIVKIFDTCRPESSPTQLPLSSPADPVTKLKWSETETSMLLVGRRSGKVQLWDQRASSASTSSPVSEYQCPGGFSVMDLEMSCERAQGGGGGAGEGETVGAGGGGTVLIASGSHVSLLSLPDLRVLTSFSMPPTLSFREEGLASMRGDGRRFIAAGSDLWVREFCALSGQPLRHFRGHHGPVRCGRYHPVQSFRAVVTGSEDGTIRMWDVREKEERERDREKRREKDRGNVLEESEKIDDKGGEDELTIQKGEKSTVDLE